MKFILLFLFLFFMFPVSSLSGKLNKEKEKITSKMNYGRKIERDMLLKILSATTSGEGREINEFGNFNNVDNILSGRYVTLLNRSGVGEVRSVLQSLTERIIKFYANTARFNANVSFYETIVKLHNLKEGMGKINVALLDGDGKKRFAKFKYEIARKITQLGELIRPSEYSEDLDSEQMKALNNLMIGALMMWQQYQDECLRLEAL